MRSGLKRCCGEWQVKGEVIYTLGTSDRSPEEFLRLLQGLGIKVVVDVRRFPSSRYDHFRGEELERLVRAEGIGYVHLGRELGGYRKGGYESYVGSEGFREGLGQVRRLAQGRKVVILCAERLPWRCHRRFIARELEREGFRVVHVIDEKRVWVPQEGPMANRGGPTGSA
jgi:uncharacterized protein (DUF488 family)